MIKVIDEDAQDDRGSRTVRGPRSLRGAQAGGGRSGRARAARVKIEDHTLSVGQCQRCKTVVEPLVSKQWFVKTKPLAEPAIAAVEDGRIQFVPENWTKTYFEWMYNIRDWCISRQLWWGHRIPAWHCGDVRRRSLWRAKTPARLPALRIDKHRAGSRRARHVVQLGSVAVLDAGLAR